MSMPFFVYKAIPWEYGWGPKSMEFQTKQFVCFLVWSNLFSLCLLEEAFCHIVPPFLFLFAHVADFFGHFARAKLF